MVFNLYLSLSDYIIYCSHTLHYRLWHEPNSRLTKVCCLLVHHAWCIGREGVTSRRLLFRFTGFICQSSHSSRSVRRIDNDAVFCYVMLGNCQEAGGGVHQSAIAKPSAAMTITERSWEVGMMNVHAWLARSRHVQLWRGIRPSASSCNHGNAKHSPKSASTLDVYWVYVAFCKLAVVVI